MSIENNVAMNAASSPRKTRDLPIPAWKKEKHGSGVRLKRVEKIEEGPRFVTGSATETSSKHLVNEDHFEIDKRRGIFAVADGMGSVPAGDVASHEAIGQLEIDKIDGALANAKTVKDVKTAELIKSVFDSSKDATLRQNDVEDAVNAILLRMNDEIEELGKTNEDVRTMAKEKTKKLLALRKIIFDQNNSEHQKLMQDAIQTIGCTMSLMKTWQNEKSEHMITVGNIGDSRIYRLRNGALERLTRDDSHVQILLDAGIVKNDQDVKEKIDITSVIAFTNKHPELKNLFQDIRENPNDTVALGEIRHKLSQAAGLKTLLKNKFGIDFKPFVRSYDMEDGDAFVVVSDGISDNLYDEEIRSIVATHFENPQQIAEELQRVASKRSKESNKKNARAKPDDMTAVAAVFLGE